MCIGQFFILSIYTQSTHNIIGKLEVKFNRTLFSFQSAFDIDSVRVGEKKLRPSNYIIDQVDFEKCLKFVKVCQLLKKN